MPEQTSAKSDGDNRLVELIEEISAALARESLDVEAMLTAATKRLSMARPGTWVAVVMNPDPETSRVVVTDKSQPEIARYISEYVSLYDRAERVPTTGLVEQVIEIGRPIVIRRKPYNEFLLMLSPAGQAFCRTHPPPSLIGSVSVAIVPMRAGGATLGTLGLIDTRGQPFIRDDEVEWIQLIADRIALGVEHLRLVGDALVHTREMDIVRAIALASRHSDDLRLTFRAIVERITALTDIDAAEIMLLTSDGQELVVAASTGYRSPWPRDHRVDARWAALDRRPRLVEPGYGDDLGAETRNPRLSHFAREGFQSFVGIPLVAPRRTIGILNVYSRDVVEWNPPRLEFLDTVAGLVALAIDRVTAPRHLAATGLPTAPGLTHLDLDVIRLVAEGLTNSEIAARVFRSESAVKFRIRRILERTGAVNRTDLVRLALSESWL